MNNMNKRKIVLYRLYTTGCDSSDCNYSTSIVKESEWIEVDDKQLKQLRDYCNNVDEWTEDRYIIVEYINNQETDGNAIIKDLLEKAEKFEKTNLALQEANKKREETRKKNATALALQRKAEKVAKLQKEIEQISAQELKK